MIQARYDVVILGGGPAGLAAALALLRQAEVSVLVVEAGSAERERLGESTPPDLLVPLTQLGLAERFRSDGHLPCPGTASVWGRPQVGYNDFLVNPMGPAWRLNRRRFDRMLAEAVAEAGGHIRWCTRLLRTRPAEVGAGGGHHLLLSTADSSEVAVHARWVVDATGPSACFARAAGARRRVDDKLYAMARLFHIRSGSMTLQTLLEATREGWWYAARLPEERVVAMFVTDLEPLQRLRAAGSRGWKEALSTTTLVGPTLAGLTLDAEDEACQRGREHHVLPIYSSLLDTLEGPGWSACGDAASSFDPLAAQGVYKALADGVAVGRHLVALLGAAARTPPPREYHLRARFCDYCENRAYLYGLERRWPGATFWRARQQRAYQALQPPHLPSGERQERTGSAC